jgi:MOSC domain-containing protein YiiM
MSGIEPRVVSVQLCPGHREPMTIVPQALAIANYGLQGDRHAREDHHRQVLLIEAETLDALELAPGDVKENITTSGIRLADLRPGQEMRIGTEVVLEITGSCGPCQRMDEIRPGLQSALEGRRGMNSRVLTGGTISPGDPIVLS